MKLCERGGEWCFSCDVDYVVRDAGPVEAAEEVGSRKGYLYL